jgi:hypothetical protein
MIPFALLYIKNKNKCNGINIIDYKRGLDFDSISSRGLLDWNLCDKVCQWHNVGLFRQVLRYDLQKTQLIATI